MNYVVFSRKFVVAPPVQILSSAGILTFFAELKTWSRSDENSGRVVELWQRGMARKGLNGRGSKLNFSRKEAETPHLTGEVKRSPIFA